MTAPSDVEPIRFETSYDTARTRPEERAATRPRRIPTEDQLFVIFGLLGAACFVWRYTIALGVAILATTTFLWAMRERSRALRKQYEPLREPATIVKIIVTETGYSLESNDSFAKTTWNNVINGFEMDGYLLVQAWRMPRLYLPIDELRQSGVYAQVRAIVDAQSAARRALVATVNARPT